MFRRKTRNSTAYTGVGLASPSAQAPDNGAMAAALTIGQNLKQTRPEIYGKPNGTSSMTRPQQSRPTSSLLKRSSSYQNSIGSTSTPRPSRTGSNLSNRHSVTPAASQNVYNIDDSFNDSFFEEVGHETDAHYSNEAQLRDLKLHHQPQTSQPKMVKKYIPTPNGIKVVEVPEETMKKDIARSNSMRSNLSQSRTGSLRNPRSHSMTNAAKSRKPNRSRLSSLVNAPRIDEQSELDYQSAQSPRARSEASRDSEDLHKQIEHEKQLARDLERQRAEFEQLKQLRLENERKLKELQSLQEEDTASFKDASSFEEKEPVSSNTTAVSDHVKSTGKGTERGRISPESEDEDVPVHPVAFMVDELDSKRVISSEQNGSAIEDTIDSYADEEEDEGEDEEEKEGSNGNGPGGISTSPHDALVNSYGDTFLPLSDLEARTGPEESADNFGIEEVPAERFDSPNLASQLRPTFAQPDRSASDNHNTSVNNISYEFGAFPEEPETAKQGPAFDPVPEVIVPRDSAFDRTSETAYEDLAPPQNFAGSIRSFSSADSKSRPIKSAMKNARPVYGSNNGSTESPARQAYLSLTTAENTRLNSKLSTSDLNDDTLAPEPRHAPAPKSPNGQQKRMSQSLRSQPSTSSQNGLAGRSLRPQSMMDNQAGRSQGGGMSSRIMKQGPQPIAPHPTSKPNYQSPSKLKAAELYAKANRRPISEFQSVPRKSSFSRDPEIPQKPTPQVAERSSHRMTLRSPPVAASPADPSPVQQSAGTQKATSQFGGGNFRSKFADSDDEQDARGGGGQGFSSRFADSDDETPRLSTSQRPVESSPIKTMRRKEEKKKVKEEDETKEKKPKKRFLKKLFGRN